MTFEGLFVGFFVLLGILVVLGIALSIQEHFNSFTPPDFDIPGLQSVATELGFRYDPACARSLDSHPLLRPWPRRDRHPALRDYEAMLSRGPRGGYTYALSGPWNGHEAIAFERWDRTREYLGEDDEGNVQEGWSAEPNLWSGILLTCAEVPLTKVSFGEQLEVWSESQAFADRLRAAFIHGPRLDYRGTGVPVLAVLRSAHVLLCVDDDQRSAYELRARLDAATDIADRAAEAHRSMAKS